MIYSKILLDHFLNPRNVGRLDHPAVCGEAAGDKCRDSVILFLAGDGEKIMQAKFLAKACAVATAAMSVLTEMLAEVKIDEARRIDTAAIIERLGGVPPHKLDCVTPAVRALQTCLSRWSK